MAASTATHASCAGCVRHQSLTVGVLQTSLGQPGALPAHGVRDLFEAVPTRAPALGAAHGLRRYPGAVRVIAARLAQHYLWYVIDSGQDGVQLLLLLLEHRVGTTRESALRRLNGVQVLLQLLLPLLLLLLLLLLEYRVDTTGESALRRLNGVQVLLQLLLPLLLLLLLLLEYRVDTTGESALRRLNGVQVLLHCALLLPLLLLLLLLLEYRVDTTGESALRRLDGVQLLLDSCLRFLLLELCVVEEIKTSGQGRYAGLNTGQVVGQLSHRLLQFLDLWSHQVRGLRGYVTNGSQQQTADEQRWRQHGDRGRPRRHCGGADVREQTVAQASGGVGSYMHLHCLLKLIESRAMDIPGRRTAQRHCLL